MTERERAVEGTLASLSTAEDTIATVAVNDSHPQRVSV